MSADKVIKTRQKQKLLIDGQYFIKYKLSKGTTSWCCDKKGTLKCTSTVKTRLVDGSHDITEGPTEHNHEDPKNRKLIVATPKKTIIAKGKSTPLKLAQIKLDFKEKPTVTDHDQSAAENKKTSRKVTIPYVDQPITPNFEVKEIKFIKWEKGRIEKLYIDGFYFSLCSLNKTTCSWVCCKRTEGVNCRGRVKTIYTSGAHKLVRPPDESEHNHDKNDVPQKIKPYVCDGKAIDPPPRKRKKVKTTAQQNMADVSMHTQLLNLIPQTDVVEFPPPIDSEIEFVILFGLRRQMTPGQIFYELQGVYSLDAPSFQQVAEYCNRFQAGYYPGNDFKSRRSEILMDLKKEVDVDLNVTRECLTVQPDICSEQSEI